MELLRFITHVPISFYYLSQRSRARGGTFSRVITVSNWRIVLCPQHYSSIPPLNASVHTVPRSPNLSPVLYNYITLESRLSSTVIIRFNLASYYIHIYIIHTHLIRRNFCPRFWNISTSLFLPARCRGSVFFVFLCADPRATEALNASFLATLEHRFLFPISRSPLDGSGSGTSIKVRTGVRPKHGNLRGID